MSEQKLKAESIEIEDLIREALSIPDGWHEEVYVEADGTVTFSEPLTQNSWVGKADAPTEPLDGYVGDLHSFSFSDVEGFKMRDGGLVEINDPSNESGVAQQGEYYELAEIVDVDEAIDRMLDSLFDMDSAEWVILVNAIKDQVEAGK